jgi:hypothetical protein
MNTMDTMKDDIYFECEAIFNYNSEELTEYYIETICGEGLDEYLPARIWNDSDNDKYEAKEADAFKWGAEWLIEYITSNNSLPEHSSDERHSSDKNFMAWLINGYDDECDEVKNMVIQMNRDKALDELLA